MTIHKDARIAQRAYEIWEEAGRPHGLDREHWLQASAEIEATMTVVNGDAPVHTTPSSMVNGDAPVHATATSVVSGDAPVHGATPLAAKPRKPVAKMATTEPARMKAVPKARTAPAKKKAPAKPKKGV
jgi:hypothetical protein